MKETKQNVHYLADFLANPVHPIQIKLAGVGGNGTHMLKGLAAIHSALLSLGHMGLSVIAYDDDTVSKSNVGRQLFYPSDLGNNKAEIFINRINRSYGFSWIAVPHRLKAFDMTDGKCNIFISCVDKGKTRVQFWEWMKNYIIKSENHSNYGNSYDRLTYWLDLGNDKTSGQVILGSAFTIQPKSNFKTVNRIPNIVEMYPDLGKNDKEDLGPSCSTMEALNRQDLFINAMISDHALKLLWKLLHELVITYHGVFYNGVIENTIPIEL